MVWIKQARKGMDATTEESTAPPANLLRFAETRLNRALAYLTAICHAFNTICSPY